MQTIRPSLFVLALIPIALGCSDKSTGPDASTGLIIEIPGCRQTYPNKIVPSVDSCFSYQFHDQLTVDFCIQGNCCPDSDRFSIDHAIKMDTITVTVADTAANLCRCLCRHWIHSEFSGLALDSYTFVVNQRDSLSLRPLYRVTIIRN